MPKLPVLLRGTRKIVFLLVFAALGFGCAGTERLPGVSGTDTRLQYDITQTIRLLERLNSEECTDSLIVNTEIAESPTVPGRSKWSEIWTVDRCGELVYYSIELTPTPEQGGTDFSVKSIEDD